MRGQLVRRHPQCNADSRVVPIPASISHLHAFLPDPTHRIPIFSNPQAQILEAIFSPGRC